MNILTLDLGTATGWAVWTPLSTGQGTLELATQDELAAQRKVGMERCLDIRFERLFNFVYDKVRSYNIGMVVFEDVVFMSSQAQAQLWGRLSGAVWGAVLKARSESPTRKIDIQVVPVSILKSYAKLGVEIDHKDWVKKSKELMRFLLQKKHPDLLREVADDNEVDAVWLLSFAKAVEQGSQSFRSIWERKKNAAKVKREAKKAKIATLSKKISSYRQ